MASVPRKQRRVAALAERKREKRDRRASTGTDAEEYAWMASLLPPAGGRVLQVGPPSEGVTEALSGKGWRVVAIDTADVLAEGAFPGERLDAVTCWLLDVGKARPEALDRLRTMGMKTAEEHRLAVQTLIYRLADRVLRQGGVLQVVDRTREPLGEALAAGMVRLQRAQAKGTTLEFVSLDAHTSATSPTEGGLVSVRSKKV